MNIHRQQAIHMIVDVINAALDGDGFPFNDLTSEHRHHVQTEIENITMELLDTLPMPVPNKQTEYPVMTVAERNMFRALRKKYNVSLKDITALTGIRVSELSDYERMKTGLPPMVIKHIRTELFQGWGWVSAPPRETGAYYEGTDDLSAFENL